MKTMMKVLGVLFCVIGICVSVLFFSHYEKSVQYTLEKMQLSMYNIRTKILHPFPKVSVLMTTYNRQDLLPRAIDSILTQTFKNFELIIIDDGSTDNSKDVLMNYLKNDSRVRVYFNAKNKGIFYNRNQLLDLARASYVAIMDSDDKSLPNRLQDEVDYLDKHPNITVVSGQVLAIEDETEMITGFSHKEGHMPIDLFFKCGLCDPSTMFKKDFLSKHQIRYDESLIVNADCVLWRDIFFAGGRFGMVEKPVLAYRRHNTNGVQYYSAQIRTGRAQHTALWEKILGEKRNVIEYSSCVKLDWLKEINREKKWFSSDEIDNAKERYCAEHKQLQ